jgi:hypothetical protein
LKDGKSEGPKGKRTKLKGELVGAVETLEVCTEQKLVENSLKRKDRGPT